MINKNLLEVCLSPDLGGLELYMGSCTKYLSNEFNLISIISENSKLEEYFQNDKYKYITLKRKSSFSLMNAFKLARIIDKNKIDLIHLHWTKDLPVVVLAKVFSRRKPKVIQSRHMTMTRFKSDFYHRFLYTNIDLIIAVTKELEKQLKKFIPQDVRPSIEQVYLGAQCHFQYSEKDISLFKDLLKLNNNFMIGFVGRINDFKGQYLLIEAMKHLKKKNLNIKAFFVGHPMKEEYLDELKNMVESYNLEDNIKFLGFTNEPYKFMQACDCIVMASKNETFGLVTIEAMHMGTAVIGANAGGVLEIIDDEETGLFFENRNSNSLASRILELYDDKEMKNQLALKGKEKVSKFFDNEIQFSKIVNLFKSF